MTRKVDLPVVGDVSRSTGLWLAAAIVVVLAFPQMVGSYWINVGIEVMTVALFAMAFNLLFGYTGMLSFGHAAYYGAAAYGVALSLTGAVGVLPSVTSFIPALLLGVAIGTVFAGVLGALCVQRGGVYFAMLTLAFAMMLYEIALQWEGITGGINGTTFPIPEVNLGVISFSPLNSGMYYYLTFLLVFGSLLVLWRIVNSPYGEILKAIRENPERAEFVGVNVKFYQWTAFLLSGVFAGLAGALISVQIFVISPSVLHWSTGAIPILSTLLGGPYTFLGPVVGGVVYVLLEELLTNITQYWEVGIGLIIIPIVIFFPRGLFGTLLDANVSSFRAADLGQLLYRLRRSLRSEEDHD